MGKEYIIEFTPETDQWIVDKDVIIIIEAMAMNLMTGNSIIKASYIKGSREDPNLITIRFEMDK